MDMEKLKRGCGTVLHNSGIKPNSVKGKAMIHAFWCGAAQAADELPPYVLICLMAGRHNELVTLPGEGEKQ